MAAFRYAFLISDSLASYPTPKISYGSSSFSMVNSFASVNPFLLIEMHNIMKIQL